MVPLPFGLQSGGFDDLDEDASSLAEDRNHSTAHAQGQIPPTHPPPPPPPPGPGIVDSDQNLESFDEDQQEESASTGNTKRKASASCVPQFIDNKRKHLEKNLSAAQRDQLLFREAKEDAQF